MPWKVINPMDLKVQFIKDWNSGYPNKTDLSQKYTISRPTVYKWLNRYKQYGIEGLREENRAPRSCPHRTPEAIVKLLVEEKLKNRKRGPRKVRAQLKRSYPKLKLPAISTVSYWLKKNGLVENRKKRLRVPPYKDSFCECKAPNDVWSLDYKGQFDMMNRRLCYPLTVTDNFSRYIIGCDALPGPRYFPTRDCLKSSFREYGLPSAIRFDNGTPFAGKTLGGLSRLMVWFILLGIIPERIRKGHPEENGRHERMHRTLKNDVLDPPAKNLKAQQEAFNVYRYDFNNQRPHEALNDQTPSEFYKRSSRPFIERPPMPAYDYNDTVRSVGCNGRIRFKSQKYFVSKLLAGMPVALKETGDGLWQINFSFYKLGLLNLRKNKVFNL